MRSLERWFQRGKNIISCQDRAKTLRLCSELNKRKKLRENEKKKAEKEAKKQEEAKLKAATAGAKVKPAEEVLDPTQYTNNRKQYIQSLREEGKNPYPHKFERSHRIDEFVKDLNPKCVTNGVFLEEEKVALTGRIMSIRAQSAKLYFFDLVGDDSKVQLIASQAQYQGEWDVLLSLRRGDIVGVLGVAGRSNTGELSVRPAKIELLSYCLHMLPTQHEV